MPRSKPTPEILALTTQTPIKEFVGTPCPYCGTEMTKPVPSRTGYPQPMTMATRDHVKPRIHGGLMTPDNRVVCCLKCNGDKGSKTLETWLMTLVRIKDRRASLVEQVIISLASGKKPDYEPPQPVASGSDTSP